MLCGTVQNFKKEAEYRLEQLEAKQQIQETVDRFETSCKDCVFAQYNGKTQYGCVFSRIEKYRESGAEIVECYDNDKEFYVIKERLCNRCRNQSWVKDGETLEDLIVRVLTESNLNIDAYLYVDQSVDSMLDILKSLESLNNQIYQPKEIVVVNNSRGKIKSSAIIKILQQKSEIKWSVESINGIQTKSSALNVAINKNKKSMFMLLNAGQLVPTSDYLNNINKAINYNLDRFIMLQPDDNTDNGLVVLQKVFTLFGGNGDKSIEEKILETVKETQETHLVKKYSDICQNQK